MKIREILNINPREVPEYLRGRMLPPIRLARVADGEEVEEDAYTFMVSWTEMVSHSTLRTHVTFQSIPLHHIYSSKNVFDEFRRPTS